MRYLLAAILVVAGAVGAAGAAFLSHASRAPQANPYDAITFDERHKQTRAGIVTGSGQTAFWIDDTVRNHKGHNQNHVPAQLQVIPLHRGCRFAPPLADERFSHVQLDPRTRTSNLHIVHREKLSRRAAERIKRLATGDQTLNRTGNRSTARFMIADVIITDASRPHYVALIGRRDIIWNFVLADGVTVSRVAVFSSRGAGVANVPAETKGNIIAGAAAQACGVEPQWIQDVRAVGWQFDKEHNPKLYHGMWARAQARFRAYSQWFATSFNESADADMIGMSGAHHALIGPMPSTAADRPEFRTMHSAQVRIADTGAVIFARSGREFEERYNEAIDAEAEKLLGAPLETLTQ